MEITDNMKQRLANLIVEEIKKEFAFIHLSKNLINSIKITKSENGIVIDIDPKRYYIATYQKTGNLKFTPGGGSYASEVDKKGGLSEKHKGFIDRCINAGIQKWLSFYKIDARLG